MARQSPETIRRGINSLHVQYLHVQQMLATQAGGGKPGHKCAQAGPLQHIQGGQLTGTPLIPPPSIYPIVCNRVPPARHPFLIGDRAPLKGTRHHTEPPSSGDLGRIQAFPTGIPDLLLLEAAVLLNRKWNRVHRVGLLWFLCLKYCV